jgi:hypothetical protein
MLILCFKERFWYDFGKGPQPFQGRMCEEGRHLALNENQDRKWENLNLPIGVPKQPIRVNTAQVEVDR